MCNTSTPEAASQIYVFLATAPTGVLPAATAGEGFAYLWSRCLIMSKKGVAPLRELLYYIEIWGMLQQYFAYNKDKNICWGRCNKLSSRVCWYPVADENEGVHPAGRKHISKHLKCFWHKHLWGHLGPRVSDIFGSKTNQAGAKMILAGGKIILAGGKIILTSRWENYFGR